MSVLYSNFIYNKKNNVIFAYIPKVACSNWKGILRSLNGSENYLDTSYAHDRTKSGLTYLSDLHEKEDILKNKDIKKYAFVRDPYSRVLSAYLNKVESRKNNLKDNDHFSKVYLDIESYRINNLDTGKYEEASFKAFLYWLRGSRSIYTFDEHWKSQSLLLDVDRVEFDRIGKFENLSDEADAFISLLGANVKFPTQKEIKFSPTSAAKKIDHYYDDEARDLVNEIYHNDFLNFNYEKITSSTPYTIERFEIKGKSCKSIVFGAGTTIVNQPIEVDSFDQIRGAGKDQTIIKVSGDFPGPFIKTARLGVNLENSPWFYEDGVPVRFSIKDLTIDLKEWKPKKSHIPLPFDYADYGSASVGIYGKCYQVANVAIINSPGCGFISACSSKGGKKDLYLDAPESIIENLEVIKTNLNGVVFAGPHDSIIKTLVTSHTKGKGVFIVSDEKVSGACDIDFIHAYASDDIAIDINAKVKARFLQGDTGRYSGVRIRASNKTIIDTIESFKTRGDTLDYSVVVESAESQINTVRIRADAGASGLLLGGFGNTIESAHIETHKSHPDFSHLAISSERIPIMIAGNQNTISCARVLTNENILITDKEKSIKRFKASITALGYTEKEVNVSEFIDSEVDIKNYRMPKP